MKPLDETVAALVSCLDEDLNELWIERASIREHDGGQVRELAEALALLDVIRMKTSAALACCITAQL
jgi:hypothetical protein